MLSLSYSTFTPIIKKIKDTKMSKQHFYAKESKKGNKKSTLTQMIMLHMQETQHICLLKTK
jgi:hypothetical protein